MHKFRKVAGLLVALAVVYATDAWSQACDYSITSFTADKTRFDPKKGETVTFTATAEAPANRYYSIFFRITDDSCLRRGHWSFYRWGSGTETFTWTGNMVNWCTGQSYDIAPPGVYRAYIDPYDDYNLCYRSVPSSIYIAICGEDTDADGDGYTAPHWTCPRPGGDCNDKDPTVYPGAQELCDNKDNDCDGEVDEGLSTDMDGDQHYTYGSCKTPNDDCNDGDPTIYPGAQEICDRRDNNCNAIADEGLSTDADGDGHFTLSSCDYPNDDCNDGDAASFPGNTEICDGKDNNCDGATDEGQDACCNNPCCDDPDCGEEDEDPTDPDKPGDPCAGVEGDPVSLLTGAEAFTRLDLSVGRLHPISIERRYTSLSNYDSQVGYGWAINYDKRLYMYADGSITMRKECGWKRRFVLSNGSYLTPVGETGTLVKNADGSFTYTEKTGLKENYDKNGRPASIVDARGNAIVFSYEAVYRQPMIGLLPANLDQWNPVVVAYDYRISKIEEKNVDGSFTGSFAEFHYDSITGRLVEIRDNAGRSVTYEHDNIGNLVSVRGPATGATYGYTDGTKGHALTEIDEGEGIYANTYDDQGRVIKQVHGLNEIEFQYVESRKTTKIITTIKDTAGNVLNTQTRVIGFDANGQIVRQTDTFGNQIVYGRNANTWIEREEYWENTGTIDVPILALRFAVNYTYDAKGNMLTKREAVGTASEKTTTWTYHPVFSKVLTETVRSVVSPDYNRVITNTYDDTTGNLKATTESGLLGNGTPYSYTTTYTYDANGRVKTIDGPRTDVTDIVTYDYDATTGYIASITQPLVGKTTYSNFDGLGNPQTVTDPNGNETTYTYDGAGRVLTHKAPGDINPTQYVYVSDGCSSCGGGVANRIDYIILPEGNKIDYEYDSLGNLIRISDNAGNSINYTYDSAGNRMTEEIKDTSGSLQKSLSYQYDALNRLVKIINPDASYTQYSYDYRSNRTSIRNPDGDITSYRYNLFGYLHTVVDERGVLISGYSYDINNNLTSVMDGNVYTTSYKFDDHGKIRQIVSPDTGTTTYTFDPAGNLASKTDAKGTTVTYQYDAANRLTKIDYPSDTDIVYAYDTCVNGKGRLCTMTDASGTTSYEYSKKGQVTKETKVIDSVTYITQYVYDQNGNLKTMTYPSGRVITYNYTNDRAVSVLNNAANLATSINYKPFGGMASITYGNGLAGSISYDNQYRVAGISTGTVMNLSYTSYDPNGNVTAINNVLDPTKNKTFDYDSLDRLAAANGPWGPLVWTYDGAGNRLTAGTSTDAYPYSYFEGTNKIQKISAGGNSLTFSYDLNGNMLTQNKWIYAYNENQRLISVKDGRTVKGQYVYNGNGQRVKKIANGVTTIFHYNLAGQVIAESTAAGAVTAEYVYLNGNPLAKIEGNKVYYCHNDHLGTPQKMTDSSGTVVWAADYKPFGEATVTVSTITNNLRFPGQYYDAETGLNYNYFRDYNPIIGRYIQADPIGIIPDGPRSGLNHLYVYVGNNPVNLIDPEGDEPRRPLFDVGVGGAGGGRGGGGRIPNELTPTTNRSGFERMKGCSAKRNKDTGEIWELDRLHKDHYEVYRNKHDWEKGIRDRAVWTDGRLKMEF